MRLFVRFMCSSMLLAAVLTGCDERLAPDAQQDTATGEPTPRIDVTLPEPGALVGQNQTRPWNPIDALLQRIGNHAAVSYATNSNGIVICTVKCADQNERRRLQAEVMAIAGTCNGTMDPPTVSFPITDLSQFRRLRPASYNPATEQARNQDIAARLQQRRAAEEATDLREIRDARAQLQHDEENMIGGPGQGFAVNKSEILSAERSRLRDLTARFIQKYGYEALVKAGVPLFE